MYYLIKKLALVVLELGMATSMALFSTELSMGTTTAIFSTELSINKKLKKKLNN